MELIRSWMHTLDDAQLLTLKEAHLLRDENLQLSPSAQGCTAFMKHNFSGMINAQTAQMRGIE
jgi:hypothetical protein